jgi:hypothetical protein
MRFVRRDGAWTMMAPHTGSSPRKQVTPAQGCCAKGHGLGIAAAGRMNYIIDSICTE